MKYILIAAVLGLGMSACSNYDPLKDNCLRKPIGSPVSGRNAVKITYFGNTTLLIEDNETALLVDGFVSRPGAVKTLFGRIAPEPAELDKVNFKRVDAILVGHAHHDHALDATALADRMETLVVGSRSFANIYCGSHEAGRKSRLRVIPEAGDTVRVGRFQVAFCPSCHVGSHSIVQRLIEGEIEKPFSMPAHYSAFKCGEVFALHISHPEGSFVVTTTAGAKPGQLRGRHADAVFLGVGLLSKESPEKQRKYWNETVVATNPDAVVPVHWDNFARKLAAGLKPTGIAESPRASMDLVKTLAGNRKLRLLDLREKVYISRGEVYIPPPRP